MAESTKRARFEQCVEPSDDDSKTQAREAAIKHNKPRPPRGSFASNGASGVGYFGGASKTAPPEEIA